MTSRYSFRSREVYLVDVCIRVQVKVSGEGVSDLHVELYAGTPLAALQRRRAVEQPHCSKQVTRELKLGKCVLNIRNWFFL